MESFFVKVAEFVDLGDEAKTGLTKILKRHSLPKGHFLLKPFGVCSHIYFIQSGLTRTFYEKEGKDITDWISSENTFACSIVSFITRMPDRRGIELLEDTVLWSMQYSELEGLCKKHHQVERLYRLITSYGIVEMQKRFDDLHFSTAMQRYATIMKEQPTLIQRVPLNVLASYIGITQETLSRMRAQYPASVKK